MFIQSILALLMISQRLDISRETKSSELSPVVDRFPNSKFIKDNQGCNEAYSTHPDDSEQRLIDISINHEKYKLLKTLESNYLSVYDKIELIQKYNIISDEMTPNLFSGNLLGDWEFESF